MCGLILLKNPASPAEELLPRRPSTSRHGKPDPEPYLAAAAGVRVHASAAVVVEDSASGIRAARAAGVGAVLGVGERALSADAQVVVTNLSGVRWMGTGLRVIPDTVLR